MANRSVRLLMLGEQIRMNREYFTAAITRASNGFLVQRNCEAAQRYLKKMDELIEEMAAAHPKLKDADALLSTRELRCRQRI